MNNRTQRRNGNGEHKLPAIPPGQSLAVYDFGDEADAVMSARPEEQTIPFLRMAQGLSPELNPGKGDYIQGLALGQIFNTSTEEIYPDGVQIVPCYKDYGYGLWIPRGLGGGFRGMLPPDHPLVRATIARMAKKYGSDRAARFHMPRYNDKLGQWSDEPAVHDTGEKVELVETGQLYVLYAAGRVEAGYGERAIVAFTRTALPQYTSYVDRHQAKKWPQRDGRRLHATIYTYRWRLSTFQDSRKAGDFYNWRLELAAPFDPPQGMAQGQRYDRYVESMVARDDPLHDEARAFFEQVRDGIVKPDYESSGITDDATIGGNSPPVDPDQPPF